MPRSSAAAVLSVLALALVALPLASTANAVVPGKPGKIAFQRVVDGTNPEIFTMKADGSNQVNITNNPAADIVPCWSPDSDTIVFSSNRDGDFDLYRMDPDGANILQLTNATGDDIGCAWSPKGKKLAFRSTRDGNPEIYVMKVDGSDPVNITNSPTTDTFPDWSPLGDLIAFSTDRDGNNEVYVVEPDGSNPVNLTNDPAEDFNPAFGPDGKQMVFASNRDGDTDLYWSDGEKFTAEELRILTNGNPGPDFHASWAGNTSGQLVYSCDPTETQTGDRGICKVNVDGTGQTVVASTAGEDSDFASWQSAIQTCDGKIATIVGTNGRDGLTGDKGDDVIMSLGDRDNVTGGGGNDRICLGDGNDEGSGGPGDDLVFGEGDDDELFGDGGRDQLYGGDGTDEADGGPGNDDLCSAEKEKQCER